MTCLIYHTILTSKTEFTLYSKLLVFLQLKYVRMCVISHTVACGVSHAGLLPGTVECVEEMKQRAYVVAV